MADFANVALSVVVTITLQSLYLAVIKFPRSVKTETNALQNLVRLTDEYLAEGTQALNIANTAVDECSKANDFLLGTPSAVDIGRESLIWDLTVVGARLKGLSSCREPDATHVRNVATGVERTLLMLNGASSTAEQIRLEAMSIAVMGQSSLVTAAYRVNEERLKLADAIEEKATSLELSLLEFWFASAFSYLGVMGVTVWTLRQSSSLSSKHGWLKILIGLLVASLMSPVMVLFRNMGNSANALVIATKIQVQTIRGSLLRLM